MGIAASDFDYISTVVRREAAIVLEKGKEYLVESRLEPLAKSEGFESLTELVTQLRKDTTTTTGLLKKVVDAMTTNETSFFRDLEPFEVIRKFVLPDLIKKREESKSLSFWCAASSTGQEPYTVCMTIREHFPQLASWKIDFLATDICRDVLDRAKKGIFNQAEINRGLPATYLIKHFEKQGNEWHLKESIRSMVRFQEMNLIKPWPCIPSCDIVFIRNVLIYFDTETKKRILGNIRKILRPDGYLFLGAAETTLNLDENFVRAKFEQPTDRSGCYRLKG